MDAHANPRTGTSSALSDRLIVSTAGLIGLASGSLLATGHVAAFVARGGWPRYQLGDVAKILAGLVRRPGDPTGAWATHNTGAPIPGPVLFWTIWATVATVIVVLAVLVWRRVRSVPGPGRSGWATGRDLRPLRLGVRRERGRGRLLLGTVRRRRVWAERRFSAIGIGPTQVGKTTCLAIPNLLAWDGSAVVTSIKDDLLDVTYQRRCEIGEVWVYDPSGVLDRRWPTHTWSPLATSKTWAGARQAVPDNG